MPGKPEKQFLINFNQFCVAILKYSMVLKLALSAILLCPAVSLATPTNESSRVVDAAGSAVSNAVFRGHNAICQPNPVGFSANGKFLNIAGFLAGDPGTLAKSATSDADGDGITDWNEATGVLSDPVSPSSYALADTDVDGVSDAREILAGTNPSDPGNVLKIVSIAVSNDTVNVVWQSRGGQGYRVQSGDTVAGLATNATLVAEVTALGGVGPWYATTTSCTNSAADRRFYKVEIP